MRANLPDKAFFLGKRILSRPSLEIVEFVNSGNDAHVFRGHDHELRLDFACKIIPRLNLIGVSEGKDTWRAEIEKANGLHDPAVVHFTDKLEWKDSKANIDCVVLVAEYIRGSNLKDFIKNARRQDTQQEITMPFIIGFLETMFDVFIEMEKLGQSHGDLHAGNILVEQRSSLRGDPYAFRVTDFGVAAATSSETRFKDDYFQLAVILKQLLEVFEYQTAEPKDQFIFNRLNADFLVRHLVERDRTIDPIARQPEKLFQRLRELEDDYEKFSVEPNTGLLTPFDFLSCEQIGDVPSILKALYSDLFLGLDDIESRNNVVVTGPRGCGKSTVFRNLSLRQLLRIGEAIPDNVKYIGVYYFCNDLYFTFPRYQLPQRQEAWDIPVHFLTATLLSELLEDVGRWAETHFVEEFRRGQQRATRKLWEVLEIEPPKEPGAETFKALEAVLQKHRRRAIFNQRNAHRESQDFGDLWGADKLQRACEALRDSFSFLRDRPIYFLIDDYSSPKVTTDLQSNLNRVLMQRSSCCFFKLATESPVSFLARDVDKKVYIERREYNLLNLGQVFLRDESGRKLEFIEEVFRRRLGATSSFPVKELEILVGSEPNQNFNADAKRIREVQKQTHWSKQTLANLCSGDIHYVINLVQVMVTSAGGAEHIKKSTDQPRIPVDVQDKCIRLEAGNFLSNLRGSCAQGAKLVAIVTAFGKVANSYLKYRNSKNELGDPPWQASRIEPYEPLKLSPEAQLLYDDLLRYSVFITDSRGKSRRGEFVDRLFLRRFLIPFFNLTFNMRDPISLEPGEVQLLLENPAEFEARKIRRLPEEVRPGELELKWPAQEN
jgi:serine/threonine protein kinase